MPYGVHTWHIIFGTLKNKRRIDFGEKYIYNLVVLVLDKSQRFIKWWVFQLMLNRRFLCI